MMRTLMMIVANCALYAQYYSVVDISIIALLLILIIGIKLIHKKFFVISI